MKETFSYLRDVVQKISKGSLILVAVAFFVSGFFVQNAFATPDTLVMWNFNTEHPDNVADGGVPANLTSVLTSSNSPISFEGGGGEKTASVAGWKNDPEEYWQVSFSSEGYTSLTLSSKQRSENEGPRDFKVEYKVGAGSWHDVSGGSVTVRDNWTSGIVNGLTLPADLNDEPSVTLRWTKTSGVAVNGGNIKDSKKSRIDDIIITGEADTDGDSVPDASDNCLDVTNLDQTNTDDDSYGDACDTDDDDDGVSDTAPDNCALIANADQADLDTDGIGNVCDPDMDGDGSNNTSDNCPAVANPGQADTDGDTIGNACEELPPSDVDGDDVPDSDDNCPNIENDQTDTDGDGVGDVCDNSPEDPNPLQEDADVDGVGDVSDNCPAASNSTQLDTDLDGAGDECDTDDDNDGVLDTADVNPLDPQVCEDLDADSVDDCSQNPTSITSPTPWPAYVPNVSNDGTDTDGDGLADVGDTDDDNDGVLDTVDASLLNPQVCSDSDADTCDECSQNPTSSASPTPWPAYTPNTRADGPDRDEDGVCDAGEVVVESLMIINEVDYDQPGVDSSEFIEIKNNGTETVELDTYEIRLINGNVNPAAVYVTIDLPSLSLLAGGHYVICADDATVPDCDLDVSPNTDLIQNGRPGSSDGAPDAIALYNGSVLVDTVSYEGDVPGYTEGTGAIADNGSVAGQGLSRYPEGNDTNNNYADFILSCVTPGSINVDYPDCANPPVDTDGDGANDSVDTDDDNDGVLDTSDTNPLNPYVCEDVDNDLADDCSIGVDQFGLLSDNNPSNDGTDTDLDGLADVGDPDDDGDGVLDTADNCQFVVNQNQTDTDLDLAGDACDTDDDGDTVLDTQDNCPTVTNPDQDDTDRDTVGDACENLPPTVVFVDPTPSNGLLTTIKNQTFKVSVGSNAVSCRLYYGVVNTATAQVSWGHSYPEDTDNSWTITSPIGTVYNFSDRYPNAAGWNGWVSPVVYDMSSIFHGQQMGGTWRLTMSDNVGRDSGSISQINLMLNGVNYPWSGYAGIWDYHTTIVDLPVSGNSTGMLVTDMTMEEVDEEKFASASLENISEGASAYYVECADASSNMGVSENRTLEIDTTAPEVSISSPSNNAMISGTVNVGVSGSDSGSLISNVCAWYEEGGAVSPVGSDNCMDLAERNAGSSSSTPTFNFNWDTVFIVEGTYNVYAIATDNIGNVATSTPVSVTINNAPRVVSAVYTSSSTVEITFNEELQNNIDGHHPSINDFRVYPGIDTQAIEIVSISYADKVVTLGLAEAFNAGDEPSYEVLPALTTIVDLAGNQLTSSLVGPITDGIAPVITLNGEASISLGYGAVYIEQGAVCTDIFDTELTPVISGTVDTGTTGTYTITYDCSDVAGNAAEQVTRTILVAAPAVQTPSGVGGGIGGHSLQYVPPIKPGDVNRDGFVDEKDFALLMLYWKQVGLNSADLNGDGVIDKKDFALLMTYWGV